MVADLLLSGIDAGKLDALALSHGHYDHFGGMVGFLRANKGKLKAGLPFYLGGEECFCTREAGIGDNVMFFIGAAQEALLVVSPEPTSLTDAYATIKVLATTQGRRDIQLLINQVGKTGEGRTIRGQLQQVVDRYVTPGLIEPVKLEFVGEVPLDPSVRQAVKRRQLLLECFPGCPAAQAVVAVATRLAT